MTKRERERKEKVIFKACTYTSEIVISNNYKSVYIHTITLRWSLWTFSVPAGTLVLKPKGGGREKEREVG